MMKKLTALLVIAFILALPLTVVAGSAYSNARADFYVFDGRNNPDADGHAIINYVKGAEAWNIAGQVRNVRPDTYTLSVGTAGTCVGNAELLDLTVGPDGRASFHAQVDNVPAEYDIVRIYAKGNACITELTAPENDGSLKFRGQSRGQ